MVTKEVLFVGLTLGAFVLFLQPIYSQRAENLLVDPEISSLGKLLKRSDRFCAENLETEHTNNPHHWQAEGANSTLRQVLIFVRHGDRTPTEFAPRDPIKDDPFWKFHGLGHLTNIGKARQSLLGRLVRYRYNLFLGRSVNRHLRATWSSGELRCIESAEALLSSFLSLDMPDSSDAAKLVWDEYNDNPLAHMWQPVSVRSAPPSMDGMLAAMNCKVMKGLIPDVYKQSERAKQVMADLEPLSERLDAEIDLKLDGFYKVIVAADLALSESVYFPNEMDATLREAKKELVDATDALFEVMQEPELFRRLATGLVTNDIIGNMRLMQQGQSDKTSKIIHYSSHDVNLAILLGTFGLWPQVNKRPDYAANLVLELHEQDSDWFVRFFYMQAVPSPWLELKMPDCQQTDSEGRCSLDSVERLIQKYRLTNWVQWMSECDNDYTKLYPFEENMFDKL